MVSLPLLNDPPPGEGCGPCTACCDVTGVVELGKPHYARCVHLCERGCGIYEHRPQDCRNFRCVWHLGILGPNIDRRPNECGVIFQLNRAEGRWALSMFEVRPGAGRSEKARYLRDIILRHKKLRAMPMANPPVHFYPYGAAVPPSFEVSERYDCPPEMDVPVPFAPGIGELVFSGRIREMLMPKELPSDKPTP